MEGEEIGVQEENEEKATSGGTERLCYGCVASARSDTLLWLLW